MIKLDSEYFSEVRAEYAKLLNSLKHLSYNELAKQLGDSMRITWFNFYKDQSERRCNVHLLNLGSFEYMFDEIDSLMAQGVLPNDARLSSRIIAVHGRSTTKVWEPHDFQLGACIRPGEMICGEAWDKGYFIAQSIGGAVENLELNVFKQKRELNRGWSEEGKLFRKMEEFCFQNPGTFCYNRPLYNDQTDFPCVIEFGLLKPNNELWVEFFNNQ